MRLLAKMVARNRAQWYLDFMHGYLQPQEYRFSHDSIELAQRAAEFLQLKTAAGPVLKVLDLCAGCGVVGLDLAKLLRGQKNVAVQIDFLEVQGVYREYFEANCKRVGGDGFRWLEMNYAELVSADEPRERYDLVVSNPPYFDGVQGSLPPSQFKARCRFFLDSDFETMWLAIARVLNPGGHALVLVRDLGDHGVDRAASLSRILPPHGRWRELDPVRGTALIHFQKF